MHWHYFGFNGELDKPFTLEISLPVGEVLQDYDGKFHFKRTEPFKCVALTHDGEWREMGKVLRTSNGLYHAESTSFRCPLTGRSISTSTSASPEANATEIQVGIR